MQIQTILYNKIHIILNGERKIFPCYKQAKSYSSKQSYKYYWKNTADWRKIQSPETAERKQMKLNSLKQKKNNIESKSRKISTHVPYKNNIWI